MRDDWNLLTDEEAAFKWCPFARVAGAHGHEAGAAVNRTHEGYPRDQTTCLGSGCAMWRCVDPPIEVWIRHRSQPPPNDEGWVSEGAPPGEPHLVRWVRPTTKLRRGSCGLVSNRAGR